MAVSKRPDLDLSPRLVPKRKLHQPGAEQNCSYVRFGSMSKASIRLVSYCRGLDEQFSSPA